eukprot:jgi/Orpsp1_1/1182863/evm.model.c7180000082974.2
MKEGNKSSTTYLGKRSNHQLKNSNQGNKIKALGVRNSHSVSINEQNSIKNLNKLKKQKIDNGEQQNPIVLDLTKTPSENGHNNNSPELFISSDTSSNFSKNNS